jgi:hypothetical protein
MIDEPPSHQRDDDERGEDRSGCVVTMNPWGCLLYPLLFGLLLYGAYRFAIWMGFAWSVGV